MPKKKFSRSDFIHRNIFSILLLNLLALSLFFALVFIFLIFFQNRPVKVLSSSIHALQTVSTLPRSIEFSFSGPVDKALIEKSFVIAPSVLGYSAWKDDKTFVFQCQDDLQEDTMYNLQFEMQAPPVPFFPTTAPEVYNLQFKTGTAPKILSSSPFNHEKNVPLTKYLVFNFDEEVASRDFENYFFIKPKAEGHIKSTNKQVIFTPDAPLLAGTSYLAGVLKGLPGASGQQLIKDYLLEFETEGTKTAALIEVKKAKIPILMFHNVGEWNGYESALVKRFKIPPENLEQQLAFVAANYQVISMQEVYDYLTNGISIPEKSIVLTFDDGWRGVYTSAFPILKRYGLPFTLYLITSHYQEKEAYLTKKQIQEMLDSGLCELGNHTVHHPMLGLMNKSDMEKEIKDANASLKQDFGVTPQTFAYPGGSYNKLTLEVLEEAGLKTAVTINFGVEQSSNELLLLKRIGVDGTDTVEILGRKLAG